MMSLSGLCIVAGLVISALAVPLLVAPGAAKQGLSAFPRHRWAGGILAVLALAWAAWEVNDMPLGFVDAYKSWLWVVGPVVAVLVLVFMNELLAPRALGGLLMLCASPVLEVQRLHESAWTVVPAVIAYVWVVAGMILVLSPYRFRKTVEWCCATDTACRCTGLVGVVLGIFLAGLGVMVF